MTFSHSKSGTISPLHHEIEKLAGNMGNPSVCIGDEAMQFDITQRPMVAAAEEESESVFDQDDE